MHIRLLILAGLTCAAADLTLLPEHARPDPFGAVVRADANAGAQPARALTLQAPRGGYVSCHLLVSMPEGGAYSLAVSGPLEVSIYREWFHAFKNEVYPDALVPVASPVQSRLPDPDNRIAKQTVQPYWLDVWISANAVPGTQTITATLTAGASRTAVSIEVRVLAATFPAKDPVTIDHNSYGASWLPTQYPALARRLGPRFLLSDEYFGLIHAHHRIFDEHRGIYHQLGYGHGGKVAPEFAPRLEGSGKTKRIADWTLFDKHYGPLLDGSAFAKTHRGDRPIPFVYLPVNPEWPASFLWWGEPGYEREFVSVLREMESHFRAKGWTSTKFELFFNHKKRYKAFHWDGDETRFPNDFPFFPEYRRMLKLAVPADSPVQFVFRTDTSWQMQRQFAELSDAIDFWVCGGGMFGWFAPQAAEIQKRGGIIWTYGGTPTVNQASSAIAVDVLRQWIIGATGFVRWQTVAPGPDPWFQFNGGGETLIYPGDRFGVAAPIASIRLKLQRNVLQDLALLDSLKSSVPFYTLKAESARRFNGAEPAQWLSKRPPMADTDPLDWTNASIDAVIPEDPRFGPLLNAGAWQHVRTYILQQATEAAK